MLKLWLADHSGHVRNTNTDTATGFHFNSPGHSLGDLRIVAIEKSKRNILYIENREGHIISTDSIPSIMASIDKTKRRGRGGNIYCKC